MPRKKKHVVFVETPPSLLKDRVRGVLWDAAPIALGVGGGLLFGGVAMCGVIEFLIMPAARKARKAEEEAEKEAAAQQEAKLYPSDKQVKYCR